MDLGNISSPPMQTETDYDVQQKIQRLEDKLQDAQTDAIRDRLLKLEIKDLVSTSVRNGTSADESISQQQQQPRANTDDTHMDLMTLAMGDMNQIEAPPPAESDSDSDPNDPLDAIDVKIRRPRPKKRKKKATATIDLLDKDEEIEPIGTGFFHSKGAPKEGAKPVDEAALGNELLKAKLDRTIKQNIADTSDIFKTMLQRDAIEFASYTIKTSDDSFKPTFRGKLVKGNLGFLKLHGFLIEDSVNDRSSQKLESWLAELKKRAENFNKDSSDYDIAEIDAVLSLASGLDTSKAATQRATTLGIDVTDQRLYDIAALSADLVALIQREDQIDVEIIMKNLMNAMYLRHVTYNAFYQLVYKNPKLNQDEAKELDDLLDKQMYELLKYILNIRHAFDKGRDIPTEFQALLKYFVMYHFRILMEIDRTLRTGINRKVEKQPRDWWAKNHNINNCVDNQKTPFMLMFADSSLQCDNIATSTFLKILQWFSFSNPATAPPPS